MSHSVLKYLSPSTSVKLTASLFLLMVGIPTKALANPSYPNFDQRYNTELSGNIEAIGNASVICDRNNASCADGLANGTRGNNNGGLAMQMLDIDSDGSTFNSSAAELNIPAGANVQFAALYWGGSLEGFGTTPAPNLTGFNQVSLQIPGSGTYQTITADDQNDRTDFGSWHTYGAFADITTLVQGAGNGTYTVANVQSNTGAGFTYPNAGWSIVVVYEDSTQPIRNISIFDGHDVVRNSLKTFNLTGIRTPPTTGFDVFMGAIANDGEVDQPDDFLHINNNNITDSLNPANNFFNGTISKFGNHVTSRTPNDPYNMVIDIDYLDLTIWNQTNNVIPTNATSIDLTLESQGDGIWPLAYFFAVEVFEPNLVTQFEKTTPSTTYTTGDTMPYTISVTNTGNDNSTNTVITDAIPTGTTFVPGSLKINGVTKTDGSGDDEAEFDGSNVIFRVGTGANASQGGQVNINDSVTMTFDVTVTATAGELVCNQASIDYTGATSGNTGSGVSDDPNTSAVDDCTEITTTAVSTNPDVVLVKRITAINGLTTNPNDSHDLTQIVNDGVANSADDESNWPAGYLVGELDAGLVKPGDEIEYTVYFLNAGDSAAEDVRICDWIQPNQSFVTGQYGGNDIELVIGGTTYNLTDDSDTATDRGEVTTVDSLPATPTCNLSSFSTTASDEVVVVDITGTTGDPTGLTTFPNTTGQGTPTNAYGYFRFTTKVDE
ncbi:DUF11 domain-containing protein [Leptolyngbyaceae cyanobacterium CCMR0082]|uniref:DUF11 domain-containing protein n=1 Tax=Adonisia turfae CCMR0082 TaxID=2304604 RepID=A0A6M0S6H9_9CYAN|nr:DUF11 domain-containing protein [Adonisia turfae]NEZ63970.1 DUF11 domain-containing protein [Adonisia turfae CCMR0082]